MRYILRGGHVRCSTKTKRRARPGADVTPPPDAPAGRGDLNSVCVCVCARWMPFLGTVSRSHLRSRRVPLQLDEILIRSARQLKATPSNNVFFARSPLVRSHSQVRDKRCFFRRRCASESRKCRAAEMLKNAISPRVIGTRGADESENTHALHAAFRPCSSLQGLGVCASCFRPPDHLSRAHMCNPLDIALEPNQTRFFENQPPLALLLLAKRSRNIINHTCCNSYE
jgi:hypothetical protein